MSVISLLSDFGLKDAYVSEMKAVILSICPQARIVDITHQIEKFSIRMGAYILASAAPYFPQKTVHVAVVDPGVGTKRRPIIVETSRGYFVGPDNGLLMLAAKKEKVLNVYEISNPKYLLPCVSKTFHGRDIFAPVAAHLAAGISPSDFGSLVVDFLVPDFSKPQVKGGKLVGEVIHVDDFGNIVSNISRDDLAKEGLHENDAFVVSVGKKTLSVPFCFAYGDVDVGVALVLVGSGGFVEVSVNQGDAARMFGVKIGDPFVVSVAKLF